MPEKPNSLEIKKDEGLIRKPVPPADIEAIVQAVQPSASQPVAPASPAQQQASQISQSLFKVGIEFYKPKIIEIFEQYGRANDMDIVDRLQLNDDAVIGIIYPLIKIEPSSSWANPHFLASARYDIPKELVAEMLQNAGFDTAIADSDIDSFIRALPEYCFLNEPRPIDATGIMDLRVIGLSAEPTYKLLLAPALKSLNRMAVTLPDRNNKFKLKERLGELFLVPSASFAKSLAQYNIKLSEIQQTFQHFEAVKKKYTEAWLR